MSSPGEIRAFAKSQSNSIRWMRTTAFQWVKLDIVFRTDNNGPPNVGVVMTDPRGRRIGFDPLTKHAWQDLPVAQGEMNCDDPDGAGACRGSIQICGPLTGTYTLELIAPERQPTA
jgi:hypothetical protein